ncbi:MAG: rhomboid family intramembrane serine protease [Bacteroidales bacterium]|jgi:membrane associated rhomboid family serine protease|nr:rhomboid family intramembrane serine protease [Bacteroidales bacterium]
MHYYQNPFEDIGRFFRSRAVLPRLILINTAIWLTIGIMMVFSFLLNFPYQSITNYIVDYLALPANLQNLALRPWTLVTYMFLHIDFFHFLFNMLWLFWFGKIFLEFLKSRQLLWIYLLGGLSGGALYVLFYNIFPVFEKSLDVSVALGASASVMAVVTAISFYVPGYSVHMLFLGRIRIFYIALFLFILDFFMIRSENAGGHIAHIGGALFGLSYIIASRKGMNFNGLWNNSRLKGLFRMRKKSRLRVDYQNTGTTYGRPLSDEEFNERRAERQKKIDDILDKISKSGYESLTGEEKDLLFKSSNSGK